jgi:hypothetical protein
MEKISKNLIAERMNFSASISRKDKIPNNNKIVGL